MVHKNEGKTDKNDSTERADSSRLGPARKLINVTLLLFHEPSDAGSKSCPLPMAMAIFDAREWYSEVGVRHPRLQ